MSAPLPLTLLTRRLHLWRTTSASDVCWCTWCEHADLDAWLVRVQTAFQTLAIPEEQWSDAAMFLLGGRLKEEMESVEEESVSRGESAWTWVLFQRIIRRLQGKPPPQSTHTSYPLSPLPAQHRLQAQLALWTDTPNLLFRPTTEPSLPAWLQRTEHILQERQLPEDAWADTVVRLLPAPIASEIRGAVFHARMQESDPEWAVLSGEILNTYGSLYLTHADTTPLTYTPPDKFCTSTLSTTLQAWRTNKRIPPLPSTSSTRPSPTATSAWLRIFQHEAEVAQLPLNLWAEAAMEFFRREFKAKINLDGEQRGKGCAWDAFIHAVNGTFSLPSCTHI
jgi:hypothetical protein